MDQAITLVNHILIMLYSTCDLAILQLFDRYKTLQPPKQISLSIPERILPLVHCLVRRSYFGYESLTHYMSLWYSSLTLRLGLCHNFQSVDEWVLCRAGRWNVGVIASARPLHNTKTTCNHIQILASS